VPPIFLRALLQIDSDLQKYIVPHVAIAKKYGKPLIAYEAGQSLIGDNAIPMQVGMAWQQ